MEDTAELLHIYARLLKTCDDLNDCARIMGQAAAAACAPPDDDCKVHFSLPEEVTR